jgi:NFACT protein C-terminal domain
MNDDDEDDAVAVDDTVEIRKLTGKPHPDDVLMYCVPVCGPYSSLQQCAYRVKLTPGNMKRGRAAKQCIEMFLKSDVKAKTPLSVYQAKQHALIKNASETDWVHAICADTKISGAGASKVAKQVSAKTKKSK